MAAQHARSVQLRRQEFGDEINYNLALCIALHMGNDGKPARLAISTLAEHGFCHYNTADRRTKEMAARSLIKITKQGKLFLYSIPGEYEDEISAPTAPEPASCADDIERINGRLENLEGQVESLVKMVNELHTIVTSSSHEVHTNLTPTVNENVNKVEKKRSREEVKNPPNPPGDEIELEMPEPYKPKYLRWLPVPLQCEKGMDTWVMWEEYRSGLGVFAEQSAKAQLKELGEWGIDRAEAAVKHSIKKGYKGIYEPNKPNPNGKPDPAADPYFADIKPVGGLY